MPVTSERLYPERGGELLEAGGADKGYIRDK
jgi:hypothetical protein